MTLVLLSAGDLSGDQYAADFMRALVRRRPDLHFCGLGGAEMEKAGLEVVAPQRALAVGGFAELARRSGGILSSWRRMNAALGERRPDLIVLVDSGGFNLPLARRARRHGTTPILYYLPPQVWAWRRYRIRKLVARVDRLAVIFPFEVPLYAERGARSDYVGHPLVDRVRHAILPRDSAAAKRELGLDPRLPLLVLMPGSRINEVDHQLPVQLETARLLHRRIPGLAFSIAVAGSIEVERVRSWVRRAALPAELPIGLVVGRSLCALRASDLVLAKPGTVTLEAALLERPMVVMGRTGALSAAIARRALRLPFLAMPNLIAGEEIVPELLQERAVPESIAGALEPLFGGPARATQLARLAEVVEQLGLGGAAERVAEIAEEMLASRGA